MSKEKKSEMEKISKLKSNWEKSLDDVIQETVANFKNLESIFEKFFFLESFGLQNFRIPLTNL